MKKKIFVKIMNSLVFVPNSKTKKVFDEKEFQKLIQSLKIDDTLSFNEFCSFEDVFEEKNFILGEFLIRTDNKLYYKKGLLNVKCKENTYD